MSLNRCQVAARDLSQQILSCMAELREALKIAAPDARVYGVALVVLDDFSDLQVYANTDQHLKESGETLLQKWYFGEWWSEGIPIEFETLQQLGEVEDWDENPEDSTAPDWLVAMTLAMKLSRNEGAFVFDGKEAVVFCSMVDSLNAIWLEELSAQYLNPPDIYASIAPDLKAAAMEWYQPDEDDGNESSNALRMAYESRLSQLENEG